MPSNTFTGEGIDAERRYASVEKIFQNEPFVATGVRQLILLRVPLKECNGYIEKKTGKKIGPQALRTFALKHGGVGGVSELLEIASKSLTLGEQQSIFLEAREYAKTSAPLYMWRTDPAIDYCIKDLLVEECTEDFTITRKAKIVCDVLKDQQIDVDSGTIRKVLESGGYEPETSLLALYPEDYLVKLRDKASEVIAHSRKSRIDNLSFEHDVWKDRPLCIEIAGAIVQGGSVNALSVLARNAGYVFKPVSFQKFMQRYKGDSKTITTEATRDASVSALRALHGITDEELESVHLAVKNFLDSYQQALIRERAKLNELMNGAQGKKGIEVFRKQLQPDSSFKLPSKIINFSVVQKNKKKVLVVTSYPENLQALRNEYAEQIKSGAILYSQWHSLKDYDDLMYVLRGYASLKVISQSSPYKALLESAKVDAIKFREFSRAVESVAIMREGEISIHGLFGSYGKFTLPDSVALGKSQFILNTKNGIPLRDITLSDEPLRIGFRKAHYHNDAAYGIEYAADIVDSENTVVATLLCTRAPEGLDEWLKENQVVSLEFIENIPWVQQYLSQTGEFEEAHSTHDAAE